MTDCSAVPLTWCGGCESYTHDALGHDCSDTRLRRQNLAGLGRRYDSFLAARRRYHRHVVDARRERELRRAS